MSLAALKIAALVVLFLAVAYAVAAIVGASRWEASTRDLRARLQQAREPVTPAVVDFGELEGLPEPVQRYLQLVLEEGQPMITGAQVRHRGIFNMGEARDQWKPFTSDQMVVAQRPGFDWDGRIVMFPSLRAHVHDAYAAGEGILHASLLGLITLADLRDEGELAEGELMRFLAEATWYPTALLPSQGVHWEAVDERSAQATLTDGTIAATLLFVFDDRGLIATVHADARGRAVQGVFVPTAWQGRFWNYEERAGMLVPLDGEVAWVLPEGVRPYWRGRIVEVAYEFAK